MSDYMHSIGGIKIRTGFFDLLISEIMKRKVLLLLTIILIVSPFIIIGCDTSAVQAVDSKVCEKDSDCVCGGIDLTTKQCFIGNKGYYEKNVDKTKICPDFCTGITGQMQTKCLNTKCQLSVVK